MSLRQKREEAIQKAIISYIEMVVPGAVVFACPNSSPRSFMGRALNAVPGLCKGAPDLIAALPGRVLFIEVKTEDGRVSGDQHNFWTRCVAIGQPYFVVRSIDDVRKAFAALGVKTREAM
ncbi:VRR-NUC domain-containing protein [Methylocystis sp. S23]